jgi:hypothetical protein
MRHGWLVVWPLVVMTGCSHQMAFRPEQVAKNQTVKVRLLSGESVAGEIISKSTDALVIQDRDGQNWQAKISAIASLTGPEPVFDGAGGVISEKEIRSHKNNKNRLLFTLSGGVLSAGTSFFLSSMLSRAAADKNRDAIITGGTVGGTMVGAWLFSRIGAHKDRQLAIQEVRLERSEVKSEADLDGTRTNKTRVKSELEQLRQERSKQDQEIKKLQQQIQEKQKK